MISVDAPAISPEPGNRTTGALAMFLLLALLMPAFLLIYHLILWFTEQTAIADGSLAYLLWAGLVGLAVQGIVTATVSFMIWRFTGDIRFRPVYAGWMAAALMSFPGRLRAGRCAVEGQHDRGR